MKNHSRACDKTHSIAAYLLKRTKDSSSAVPECSALNLPANVKVYIVCKWRRAGTRDRENKGMIWQLFHPGNDTFLGWYTYTNQNDGNTICEIWKSPTNVLLYLTLIAFDSRFHVGDVAPSLWWLCRWPEPKKNTFLPVTSL